MANSKVLLAKLAEIHEVLLMRYQEEPHVGGMSGIAGMALFEFYYAKLTDKDEYAELGLEMISLCMDKINEGYTHPTFASGLAGMGWVMDHLAQQDFLDNDNDELLTELDEYLYEQMMEQFSIGHYDYLHGGIGYGLYFLNRYKSTTQETLREVYLGYLSKALEELDRLAEKDGNRWKWLSDSPLSDKPSCYDFSHSHGISGIANFLGRVYKIEALQSQAKPLLEGAIEYLLSFKSTEDNCPSFFPPQIHDVNNLNYKGRVAWCYGDLGVAFALSRAGKVLQRTDLIALSQEIYSREAAKRDPKDTLVMDSGFCHGSFGNAHIFQYLFQETNDPLFKENAEFWIEDGFKKATYEDGAAGFKQWGGQDRSWLSVHTVLEGIAGIGLVLINQLDEEKSPWDEIFMLS